MLFPEQSFRGLSSFGVLYENGGQRLNAVLFDNVWKLCILGKNFVTAVKKPVNDAKNIKNKIQSLF
ncbi:MAG: hypothetical protein N2654_02525 [Deltaproteobacteria bacterium]|nr:hypothetical protein [Deltaproteobacteria bacterium]